MKPGNELLFLALGGSGEIGMNVNLYGCQGKWIMVDLGMTFADPAYPGIDLVLPDLEFIEKRRKDLLAIVLTHGHEDHIGAIPYLAGAAEGEKEEFVSWCHVVPNSVLPVGAADGEGDRSKSGGGAPPPCFAGSPSPCASRTERTFMSRFGSARGAAPAPGW